MVRNTRVRTPGAKVAVVLVGVVLVVMVGVALAMVDFARGYLVATGLIVVLVVLTARSFRGADESDEPREWWRMTASPTSATVVGVLFLLQAVTTAVGLVRGDGAPVVWVGAGVGIVVAAGYFHSAVRRSRRYLRETPAS